MKKVVLLFALFLSLSACSTGDLPFEFPFDIRKITNRFDTDLKKNDVYVGDPVFIRIFKDEHVLELWMKSEDNHKYRHVKSYSICKWSGELGPKFYEGDHQAPEGFYQTNLLSLNPNSRYHLSFNINYPNTFDQAYGRTGSFIMVHGDCVSEGCYAMTDRGVEEIYLLVERALGAGQENVPVHIFPFRMTEERLMREHNSRHYPFWRNLKEGYDYFETGRIPPNYIVNYGMYDFY